MVSCLLGFMFSGNVLLRVLCRSAATKRELSNTAKFSVFKSPFLSLLTYGNESLVISERFLSQVHAGEMGFL